MKQELLESLQDMAHTLMEGLGFLLMACCAMVGLSAFFIFFGIMVKFTFSVIGML